MARGPANFWSGSLSNLSVSGPETREPNVFVIFVKVDFDDDIQIPEGAVSITTETQAHICAEKGDLKGLENEFSNVSTDSGGVDPRDKDAMTPLMRAARTG